MVAQGNVGIAFGLVAAAGLATTIGACIVWCANLAQPRLLAGSLGFAAGVMLYVSFAEILMRKSLASFQAVSTGNSADAAFRWTTLCFFGGMLLIAILDRVVHVIAHIGAKRATRRSTATSASTANLLSHEDHQDQACCRDGQDGSSGNGGGGRRRKGGLKACWGWRKGGSGSTAAAGGPGTPPAVAVMPRRQETEGGQDGSAGGGVPGGRDVEELGSAACSPRAAAAAGETVNPLVGSAGLPGAPLPAPPASDSSSEDGSLEGCGAAGLSSPRPLTEPCDPLTSAVVAASCPETVAAPEGGEDGGREGGRRGEGTAGGGSSSRTPPAVVEIMENDHHAFMLKKMGLLTALAIFIHNFPEGLATFVGALTDTTVGVGLAVAIAMHNIPEGICVAMPIYYATGSRWKGFAWAFLSGVSEPVGGLIGYLALNGNSDLSFAIVFGIVAGMMVYISIKELIPTALRYDPKDSVATTCVVLGMVVMAASLLLFTL